MTVSVQQIQSGVSRYINEELAKKKTGPHKFLIHFLESLLTPSISQTIISLQSVPLLSQTIFDENGNIHLSALTDAARSALEKSGGKIQALGFVFDQTDIDALIKYITL
jgi:hypothetical protein